MIFPLECKVCGGRDSTANAMNFSINYGKVKFPILEKNYILKLVRDFLLKQEMQGMTISTFFNLKTLGRTSATIRYRIY